MNTTGQLRGATPTTISFFRGYLVTMRPYLLFVSGVTGIAGMSFGDTSDPARLVSIFAACFLSYGFGQALTDCFQTDTDAISSPYRPLTRGAISRNTTLAVSLAGLTGCISVLGYWEPMNILLGTLAGGGLATYTWFKRRWWGGPWYNAWI
ncbi:MAG TPA: UbiA family prenyltransferase, partial [Bacteroidota bacterium]|nr:UbiA family prenyltransferase [Bacteroidota bacterium]